MSIATSTAKVQYTLASTVQALPIPFYFLENGHIKAIRARAGVADYVMILGTDYTLAGAGDEDGGTLTTIATNMQVGDIITIKRDISVTQLVNYVYNDRFPAETHERALDKLTMIAQQLKETIDRAVQFPESEVAGSGNIMPPAAGRAAKILGFDASGNGVQLFDPVSAVFASGVSIEVSSLAALKSVPVAGLTTGYQATVAGYYSAGDGGGGLFTYDSASSATDDGGMVIQPSVGSGRWKRVLTDLSVNPRFFGAKGDGVTQDHTAFQAAVTWARDNGPTNSSSVGGNQPGWKVRVTKGKYLFGARVELWQRTIIEGDGAIITAASGVDLFKVNGFQGTHIEGFIFSGGQNQVKIETNNVAGCRCDIHNCIFDGPGTCAVATDNTSQSTLLNIQNCFFMVNGKRALYSSCDLTTVEKCWVSTTTSTMSVIYNLGGLTLINVFFVPNVGTAYPWVENRGVSVKSMFCRYGGEGGGNELFHNYKAPNQASGAAAVLDFQRNSIWGANTIKCRFFEVPDQIYFLDNEPASSTDIFQFIITSGYTKCNHFRFKVDDNVSIQADTDGAADLNYFHGHTKPDADTATLDNILGSSVAFSGFSTSVSNLGTGGSSTGSFDDSAANPFLGKSTIKVVTGSANGSGNVLRFRFNGPDIPGSPNGPYTFGMFVKTNKSIPVQLQCGRTYRAIHIPASDDYGMIWVTGHCDSTRKTVTFDFIGLPLNATFYITAPFAFKGASVRPLANYLYATTGVVRNTLGLPAVSAAPSGVFSPLGDLLFAATIGDGRPVGWVNTTYGSSPTYRPFGQMGHRTNAGSPSGSVTPYFIGEELLDTTNVKWYKSTGTGNTDWVALN